MTPRSPRLSTGSLRGSLDGRRCAAARGAQGSCCATNGHLALNATGHQSTRCGSPSRTRRAMNTQSRSSGLASRSSSKGHMPRARCHYWLNGKGLKESHRELGANGAVEFSKFIAAVREWAEEQGFTRVKLS